MEKPWAADTDDVIRDLNSNASMGLAEEEARERLAKYGPNKLIEERQLTFLDVFWEEVREPMIILLLIVGLFYSLWGELRDAVTIFVIIITLVFAEVFNEYRAKKSIEMLKRLSSPTAGVIRDGRYQEILTTDIVSGDILIIKSGERIPADCRIIEAYSIAADESVLTGESVPEEKEAAATLSDDAPVADRRNMLFAGTVVTRGRGKGIATATGMETEFGRITGLVKAVKEPKTPLQLSMKQLSGWLVYLAVSISILIPLLGFIQGQDFKEMVLTGLGLAGFIDPPRAEVKEAVRLTKEAGVKVIMITGDHENTARRIADDVGIDSSKVISGKRLDEMGDEELRDVVKDAFVYARITPEHKLRIVRALKENGEVVAVTGDGINDAPALKEADIGVAMGKTGTDVAKETADMILQDDNFTTITKAIAEGRKLYDNLKKGVRYYLACKTALIAIFTLPVIFKLPLPFAPIQIILLELFMDIAASASFVAEPAEGDVMRRRPRDPKVKFMNRAMTMSIFTGAAGLFFSVSVAYLYALKSGAGQTTAQTIAFATWMLTHVFLAFNMRSERESIFKLGLFTNKVMVIWAAASIAALVIGGQSACCATGS